MNAEMLKESCFAVFWAIMIILFVVYGFGGVDYPINP